MIALPDWLAAYLPACLSACLSAYLTVYPMAWQMSFGRFIEFSEQIGHLYRSLSGLRTFLAHAGQGLIIGISSEYAVDNGNTLCRAARGNAAGRLVGHDFKMISLAPV